MKKILVIKHGSLGDLTFALEAMFAIRKKYPNSLIHLLTEKRYISFLTKTKIFDKIIVDNRKDFLLISFLNLLKLLKENFDVIIDLQNSQRTSLYNLFFRLFNKGLVCSSQPFAHLRYKIPIQGKEAARVGLSNQLKMLNINVDLSVNYDWLKVNIKNVITQSIALIIPGVSKGNEYKQWQPEKFAEIAQFCESKNLRICIVGTKSDLLSAKKIILKCKNVLNKIDFSPPEVIYSIALKSSLIFSNDTGPGHIASLSNNHMIWILNDNSISGANISDNTTNHKILANSVKSISSKEVIQYIEKNKLLNFYN